MTTSSISLSGAFWNNSPATLYANEPHLLGTWVTFIQPAIYSNYLLYRIPKQELRIPAEDNTPLPGAEELEQPLKGIERVWCARLGKLNLTNPTRWKLGVMQEAIEKLGGKNPVKHLKPVTAMVVVHTSNFQSPDFLEVLKNIFDEETFKHFIGKYVSNECSGVALYDKEDNGVFFNCERLDSMFTLLKVTTISPYWKERPKMCVLDKHRAVHIIKAIDTVLAPVQDPWKTETPDGLLELARELTLGDGAQFPPGTHIHLDI